MIFCLPNSELFNTVLDMLATLIHSTLMSDAQSDSREENRRHYYNLVKKIKKVLKSYDRSEFFLLSVVLHLAFSMFDYLWLSRTSKTQDCNKKE